MAKQEIGENGYKYKEKWKQWQVTTFLYFVKINLKI